MIGTAFQSPNTLRTGYDQAPAPDRDGQAGWDDSAAGDKNIQLKNAEAIARGKTMLISWAMPMRRRVSTRVDDDG